MLGKSTLEQEHVTLLSQKNLLTENTGELNFIFKSVLAQIS